MFKALLHKTLFDGATQQCSMRSARATIEVELPFAPFVGLTIIFGQGAHGCVEQVSWDIADSEFRLFCGFHFMGTGHPEFDFHSFGDWVASEADCGWQTSKIVNRERC